MFGEIKEVKPTIYVRKHTANYSVENLKFRLSEIYAFYAFSDKYLLRRFDITKKTN